jgi:hypothetical protein
VVGLPLAYMGASRLGALLFGVEPGDPMVYTPAALLALTLALTGSSCQRCAQPPSIPRSRPAPSEAADRADLLPRDADRADLSAKTRVVSGRKLEQFSVLQLSVSSQFSSIRDALSMAVLRLFRTDNCILTTENCLRGRPQ